jgi:hypothetical protein
MSRLGVLAAELVLGCVALGCGAPSSDEASCQVPLELPVDSAPPTTATEVLPIVTQRCALGGCHLSAPGAGGLVLDVSSSAWVSAMVSVPSEESPSMDLISPGRPEQSWVVYKVFGALSSCTCSPTLGCGIEMPFGASLSQDERDTIVSWIKSGAPPS